METRFSSSLETRPYLVISISDALVLSHKWDSGQQRGGGLTEAQVRRLRGHLGGGGGGVGKGLDGGLKAALTADREAGCPLQV